MSLSTKSLAVCFLVFLAGSGIGFLVGGYIGSNFGMNGVLRVTLHRDAKDMETQIATLRAIRGGNNAQAIELLQASLDDQFIIFDPQDLHPIESATQNRGDDAIRGAKAYRQEFPRQSNRARMSMQWCTIS